MRASKTSPVTTYLRTVIKGIASMSKPNQSKTTTLKMKISSTMAGSSQRPHHKASPGSHQRPRKEAKANRKRIKRLREDQ